MKEQREELVKLLAEKSFYEEAIKNGFIEHNRVYRNILGNHSSDVFLNKKGKIISCYNSIKGYECH